VTAEELAKMLDGREMGQEIFHDESVIAKASGLVVVFGYSDDNVEFRGAVDYEMGAYGGKKIRITPAGLVLNKCDEDACPYYLEQRRNAAVLRAVWADTGQPAWTYDVPWPHSTFNVMEDGEVFCRGVVFALSDVPTREEARRG
jgi:hypothetical protein